MLAEIVRLLFSETIARAVESAFGINNGMHNDAGANSLPFSWCGR
jgi:hypothetical protein